MVREGQSGYVDKSKTLRAGAAPAYETDGDAALNLHDRDNGDRAGTRTERKSKRAKGVGKLTLVPIGALRADPRNPRKHSRIQVRAIARSIDAFGSTRPFWSTNATRLSPVTGAMRRRCSLVSGQSRSSVSTI